MKSPKAVLSESIAEALATYFVIEPHKVETNLLNDAGITLKDVALQPIQQRLNSKTVVSITGQVQQAGFYWNWGSSPKDGGSSFVNSAKLTISGLEFLAKFSSQEESQEKSTTNNTEKAATMPLKDKGRFQQYIDDQVNRIIDTLTLSITDFQIKIQMENDEHVLVYGGESIEIETVTGRASEKDPLKQTLTLKGIFARLVVEQETISSHPLLEPFSYATSCVRVSGKRFQSGIATGLDIQGPIHNDSTGDGSSSSSIVLHAGITQLEFLNRLGGYLLTSDTDDEKAKDGSEEPDKVETLSTPEQEKLQQNVPTTINLPLQGLTVVFPNGSKISVQGLLLEYVLDGTLLQLSGHDGFVVNDATPMLLDLPGEGCQWKADMVTRQFRVFDENRKMNDEKVVQDAGEGKKVHEDNIVQDSTNSASTAASNDKTTGEEGTMDISPSAVATPTSTNETTTTVASIQANQSELKLVMDGVLEMGNILLGMTQQPSGAAHEVMSSVRSAVSDLSVDEKLGQIQKEQPASSPPSSPWTVDLEGEVEFCLRDATNAVLVECKLRHIHADTGNMSLSLESIDEFHIPGTLRLKEQVLNTTMSYDGKLLDLELTRIVARLVEPVASQKPGSEEEELQALKMEHIQTLSSQLSSSTLSTEDSGSSDNSTKEVVADDPNSPSFVLPFAVKVSIGGILVFETDGETLHTRIKAMDVAIGPDIKVWSVDQLVPTGKIRTLLVMEEYQHKMIQAIDPKLTAVIDLEHLDKIESFDLRASSIGIAAGYSVLSWKNLWDTGDENRKKREQDKKKDSKKKERYDKNKKATKLPFARVHPLKVNIAVNKGKMINLIGTEGTTLHFNMFNGTETTTSEDLLIFYSKHMVANVPGAIVNMNVLGLDIGDEIAYQVGVTSGAGALAGVGSAATPVAGVLGIVGYDAIKGAINAGKRERGAQVDDKSNFSDFFRGVGQSIKEATDGGAKSRGKTKDQEADALDWVIGATEGAGEYADKNKARLGGAGAGTVGFAYGMMLGGPVGAVAGAVIASTSTSATIDLLDRKFNKKRQSSPMLAIDEGANTGAET